MIGLFTTNATRSNGSSAVSKGYRRIFSRFEKLDVVVLGFIAFAFIIEALR